MYFDVHSFPVEGEVWLGDLGEVTGDCGSEQRGIRPLLIVSNDKFNEFSPRIQVIPITSKKQDNQSPVHVKIKSGEVDGITKDSVVLVECFQTIEKTKLMKYLGVSNERIQFEVAACMMWQFPFIEKKIYSMCKPKIVACVA